MGKKSKKSKALKVADTASMGILGGAFTQTAIGHGFHHAVGHTLGHTVLGKAAVTVGWGLAHTPIGVPIIAISAIYQGFRHLTKDRD